MRPVSSTLLGLGRLLLLASVPLAAQMTAHRTYDHRDGLPQSQVVSMLEDREGFLWVGTMDGLARLGPRGFTSYTHLAPFAIHAVQAMVEAPGGGIWAAATGAGLVEIRGSQMHQQFDQEGRPLEYIDALCPGPGDQIWVGTRVGLYTRKAGAFVRLALPGRPQEAPVTALALDPEGRLWIAGFGTLGTLQGETYQPQALPPDLEGKRITALRYQPGVGLWLMTPRTLYLKGPRGWAPVPLEPEIRASHLRNLTLDQGGALMVTLGQDGILRRRQDGTFDALIPGRDLPHHSVQCVLQDRRGNLWMGTDGAGLVSRSALGLRQQVEDPLRHTDLPPVTAFLELAPGRILMGTPFGLTLWEDGRGIVRHWTSREGMPGGEIWYLLPDGAGGAVVCSLNGLVRWRNGRLEPFAPALQGGITLAAAAMDGQVWVLTERDLIQLDGQGRLLRRIPYPPGLVGNRATTLVAQEGVLYLGSMDGLYRYRPGSEGLELLPSSPQGPGLINALSQGPQGSLWVAADRGAFQYLPGSPGHWRGPLDHSDLLVRQAMWVKPLPDGALAIGLNRGVAILRHDTLLPITRNQGLHSDETNQGSVLVDSQGQLWFGTTSGFCRLDLNRLPAPPTVPRPRIMEALWRNGSAWKPERLDLPAAFGTLTLSYDTPFPGAPLPPRYEIWVGGVHGSWTPLDPGAASVQFAALPSGRHLLRLRASLDGTTWTEAPPLQLHVRQAWYTRWSVRLLGLIGMLGLTGLALKFRTRRLQRRNQRLQEAVDARTAELSLHNRSLERLHQQLKHSLESRIQLVRTVSHDLRSPLTSILLIIDRLRVKAEARGHQEPSLDILQREAERLGAIVTGLLDHSREASLADNLNLRLCHPGELLLGITDTLSFRAEGRGLRCRLDMAPETSALWVLADVTALQQVLFNLLENALKFTEAPGTVGMRTRREGDAFVVEVWDTGRGIPPEALPTLFEPFIQVEGLDSRKGWGLGLSICKTLVEAHGGAISVASEPGKGSTFTVSIPLVAS